MIKLPKGVTLRHTPGGTPVLRVHYSADPDRDENWAKRERAKYSSQGAWDREQNIIHEAGGGERLFAEIFDRWLETKILVDPLMFQLPPTWKLIAGFDHGKANPTAALVAAVDFDGNLWCISEYYQPGLSPHEHAQNLRLLKGFSESIALADPSIFYASHAQDNGVYRAISWLYENEGIRNLVPAPLTTENTGMERITAHWLDLDHRDPSLRILCPVNLRHIEQPMYGICNWGCPNLLWELKRARRMELTAAQMVTRNPTEKIVDKENHARDTLKYIVLSMPEPTKKTAHALAMDAIKNIPATDPTSRMIFYNQALEKNEIKPVVLGRRGRYNALRTHFRRRQ